MITSNGHMVCGIDVETTGLNHREHEIWELACIPVNDNLEADKTRPWLELMIIPEELDSMQHCLSQRQVSELLESGVDVGTAQDLFSRWFKRCGLATNKRILPLAHNWKFDQNFIIDFLGWESYQEMFDGRHRDTLQLAIGINDAHELAGLEVPYPAQNLTALCKRLSVNLEHAHRALEDTAATIEVHKKMVKRIAANL